MKNFSLKSIFFGFLVALTTMGCSSDADSESCPTINCQNGGTFTNCECYCPDGYSGVDCGTQITPTRIKVTKITVKRFPNYDNDGLEWDITDGPEIFVRLGQGSGSSINLLYDSGVFPNAISDGVTNYDFIPTTNIYITNPLVTHTIILGDFDTANSHDLMGGFTFTPYNSLNDFPNSILLQDLSIPLSFELFFTYEW